jgi:hypothetical protein
MNKKIFLVIISILICLSRQDLEFSDLNSFIENNLNYCKDLSYTIPIKLPPITIKFGKFCNMDVTSFNSDKLLNSIFAYQTANAQNKVKIDMDTFIRKWFFILSKNNEFNLTESENKILLDSFKKIDISSINKSNWIFYVNYENEMSILQKDSTIEIFDSICNSCKKYLFTGFNNFYNKLK